MSLNKFKSVVETFFGEVGIRGETGQIDGTWPQMVTRIHCLKKLGHWLMMKFEESKNHEIKSEKGKAVSKQDL